MSLRSILVVFCTTGLELCQPRFNGFTVEVQHAAVEMNGFTVEVQHVTARVSQYECVRSAFVLRGAFMYGTPVYCIDSHRSVVVILRVFISIQEVASTGRWSNSQATPFFAIWDAQIAINGVV